MLHVGKKKYCEKKKYLRNLHKYFSKPYGYCSNLYFDIKFKVQGNFGVGKLKSKEKNGSDASVAIQ